MESKLSDAWNRWRIPVFHVPTDEQQPRESHSIKSFVVLRMHGRMQLPYDEEMSAKGLCFFPYSSEKKSRHRNRGMQKHCHVCLLLHRVVTAMSNKFQRAQKEKVGAESKVF